MVALSGNEEITVDVSNSDLFKYFKDNFESIFDSLKAGLVDYHYSGFNVEITFKTLMAKAASEHVKTEDFVNDLITMLSVFHFRGNRIDKISPDNTPPKGVEALNKLWKKYGITHEHKRNTDLTLARISQAFPSYSKLVFDKVEGMIIPVVSEATVMCPGSLIFSTNFVTSLFKMSSVKENGGSFALALHNIYQTKTSYKLQIPKDKLKKMKKEPEYTFYSKSITLSYLAINGSKVPDSAKTLTNAFDKSWIMPILKTLDSYLLAGLEADFEYADSVTYMMFYCSLHKKLISSYVEDLDNSTYSNIITKYPLYS